MPKPEIRKNLDAETQLESFAQVSDSLAELGRISYSRGWALGTSGNFSAVISRDPFRLAITGTGLDKGLLTADNILVIDSQEATVQGSGRPSDEAKLHLTLVRILGVGAVVHTHSVWSTVLSEACAGEGGIGIEGYEMLKGLNGVRTHKHREWLPIIENSQDMIALAQTVEKTLREHTSSHGFLLHRHGLYTWGKNLNEAKRHLEILEFLLEVVGRKYCSSA